MSDSERYSNERLGRLLRRSGHFLYHQCNHDQQSAVMELLCDQGAMNQKELQQKLGVKPGSVSELISKLEAKGLVERERDPQDRRKVVLNLTDRGRKVAEIHRERPVETLFTALDEQERQQLTKILEKLIVSWGVGGGLGL